MFMPRLQTSQSTNAENLPTPHHRLRLIHVLGLDLPKFLIRKALRALSAFPIPSPHQTRCRTRLRRWSESTKQRQSKRKYPTAELLKPAYFSSTPGPPPLSP